MNNSKQIILTDLPECILYSLQNYLIEQDYRELLNTTKNFFFIRKESIIYHLTMIYSIEYCENESFRDQLLQKVNNPLKQIILILTYSTIRSYEKLWDLIPVYLICISFPIANHTFSLRNIKEMTIFDYDLDVNSLININQCEKVTFDFCSGIANMSLLKDCKHITFLNCPHIRDFRSLGSQRSLFIQGNDHLTNVMNFHSIHTLILQNCSHLVDVSPLRGVYDLSLRSCMAIKDISSLGGHHHFEMDDCSPMLLGYHALKDISMVKLICCNISDVSILSNAKVVYLQQCNSLVDVSSLRGVKDITLISCLKIEDLSMLTNVKKLTLQNLPRLKNYEGVDQIMNLSLEIDSKNLMFLERLLKVKEIKCSFDLSLSKILSLLPSLTNLHSLTVCHHSSIIIDVCLAIHTVIIEHSRVKSISGLGKNRVVRFFYCRGDVVDVSSLATVPFVSIYKCRFDEVNYESLVNVPHLRIEEEKEF